MYNMGVCTCVVFFLAIACANAFPPDLVSSDAARAHLGRPPTGSPLLASSPKAVVSTINAWLHKNLPEKNLKPCFEFSVQELNDILAKLTVKRHPALQKIYDGKCETPHGCDARRIRHNDLTEYQVYTCSFKRKY